MCISINDTHESMICKLKIVAICVVILTIVIVAIKYGTDSGEEDYYDYSDRASVVNDTESL